MAKLPDFYQITNDLMYNGSTAQGLNGTTAQWLNGTTA
jgi:hypothetical protein